MGMAHETDELSIQHAILELMLDGKVWSNAELKARLVKILPLTAADRSVGQRPKEAPWENRVNNALSASRASSLYGKGHVASLGHGLRQISEEGRRFISGDFDLSEISMPD